jgi:hypothetical protein
MAESFIDLTKLGPSKGQLTHNVIAIEDLSGKWTFYWNKLAKEEERALFYLNLRMSKLSFEIKNRSCFTTFDMSDTQAGRSS